MMIRPCERRVCALPVFACVLLSAEESGMSSEQAARMIRELGQIRQVLLAIAGGPVATREVSDRTVRVTLDGEHLGRSEAPVTIVEFSDYDCSYCKIFYRENFKALKRELVDTGKVRFYVRDLPTAAHEFA